VLFATAVVDNGSAAVEPWLTQEVCGAFQRWRKLIFVVQNLLLYASRQMELRTVVDQKSMVDG